MIAQFQYFGLILGMLFSANIIAQNLAITDKGDTVVLYQDGTWSMVEKHSMSMLTDAEIRTTKVDPFTGKKSSVTKTWMNIGNFDQGKLFGNTSCVDSVYAFNVGFTNYVGCLQEFKSSIQVKLENNEIVELLQVSPSNCSSFPTATFLPIPKSSDKSDEIRNYQYDQLNKLAKFDWILIKVMTESEEIIIEPVKSNKHQGQLFFKQHLQALEYQIVN